MSSSAILSSAIPVAPGMQVDRSFQTRLLAQKPAAPTSPPKALPAFSHSDGWLGFTSGNGEALQVKLGKNISGRLAVQTANGKIYAVPTSITSRAAIGQWLNKADLAGAVSGAWPNPGAASKIGSFKLNRAQLNARERLSGTWNVTVSGIRASTTYSRASIEYDKLKNTLKVYAQPPGGELQLFEIDCPPCQTSCRPS